MNTLPPGPKRTFPGSLFLKLRRDPLGLFHAMAREYGDITYFSLGSEKVYFINHPDLIREVLVVQQKNFIKGRALERAKRLLGEGLLTSEVAFHLRQRRMMQPAFHQRQIGDFARTMSSEAARLCSRWQDGATTDIAGEMMRLTLAIVGQTLFSADVEGDARDVGAALTTLMKSLPVMMLPFAGVLEKLPLPAIRRMKAALLTLDSIIYGLIRKRRASGEDPGDLLSMLLNSQDEEDPGARMSDQQVRDEAMTLFLAGHETTANALNWTWSLLATHPGIEACLHEELDRLPTSRLPQPSDLPALPFTEKIIRESFRLYPTAWIIGRRALGDFQLGGYTIPARALVLMSQSVMHRDPRYFKDPDAFQPGRWTPEFTSQLPKFAYFPFGGGARQCIGEGFAWMEAILLTATIARQWKLRLLPGHEVIPHPMITLRPKNGLPMTVHRR